MKDHQTLYCDKTCDNLRDKIRDKIAFCRECGNDAMVEIDRLTAENAKMVEKIKQITIGSSKLAQAARREAALECLEIISLGCLRVSRDKLASEIKQRFCIE